MRCIRWGGGVGGHVTNYGQQYAEKAEQLSQMGFDKQKALEILQMVNGNVEEAVGWL